MWDKGCGLGAGCLFVLLWIEGKEAVSRAGPVLQGRVKTHCPGSYGAQDTPLPRTQPWKNVIRIAPGDALTESWGGCSGSEGHGTEAITAVISSRHGTTGPHPVGSADLQSPPHPTPTPLPRAEESLDRGAHAGNGEPREGPGMTRCLPGLLCLSLLPSRRLFVLHNKYVGPLLPLSLAHLSPEPAPGGLSLCPRALPCRAPGPRTAPCCLQGPAVPGAQGAPAARCPHASSLVPTGPVTCPGSQGKAPEFAHNTGSLGRQGQRPSPRGQVPTSSSPGPPGGRP